MGAEFQILTVCTGNVCRSPLAEQLLRMQLADVPEVSVSSAGVRALEGQPMPVETQQVARALGVADPELHRGRQLTAEMLDQASLILAMAREHRRAIVELNPRAARRTLTIRELARYAPVITEEDVRSELFPGQSGVVASLKSGVRALAIGRALVPGQAPELDDVTDPFGRELAVHQLMARQLEPAVSTTVRYLHSVWGVA